MPTEKKEGQPEVQQPEQEPAKQEIDFLPDENTDANQTDKSAELAKELEQVKQEAERIKQEKVDIEKRLHDNQEYISRTRNLEKIAPQPETEQRRTFDDYLADLDKIVDTDFENDPKQGLKKAVRKLATDIAFDRDLERQNYDKRIKEAEENAFRKALALDPEKGRMMKEMESLEKERPDLANLTFDQKMEWIGLRSATQRKTEITQRVERDRELSADVGGGYVQKGERMPGWLNDPEVLREARDSGFTSKKDILEWANPELARLKAEKTRPQL